MGADGPYRIHDATFVAEVTRQIEDWKRELGFEEGLISVRAFFDDELWVGVEAVPDHLDDDVDETAEERRERQESRQKWIEAGQDSSSSGGPRPVR